MAVGESWGKEVKPVWSPWTHVTRTALLRVFFFLSQLALISPQRIVTNADSVEGR